MWNQERERRKGGERKKRKGKKSQIANEGLNLLLNMTLNMSKVLVLELQLIKR